MIDNQPAIVDDRTGAEGSVGSSVADLESRVSDRGGAGVGVVAGEDHWSASPKWRAYGKIIGATDDARDRVGDSCAV